MIYVNRDTHEFKDVIDDNEYGQTAIEDLQDNGFNFYVDGEFIGTPDMQGKDKFVQDLMNMPKAKRVALDKALCKKWSVEFDEDDIEDDLSSINGFSDVDFVINWLQENLKDFRYWYITGNVQGEVAYVWTFERFSDEDAKEFMEDSEIKSYYDDTGYYFKDYLYTIIYGETVAIYDVDKHGKALDNEPNTFICDLSVDNYQDDVDEYMEKNYNMVQADSETIYY